MAVKIFNIVVLLTLTTTVRASVIVNTDEGNGLDYPGRSTQETKASHSLANDNEGSAWTGEVRVADEGGDKNDATKDQLEAKIAARYCSNTQCLSLCHRLGYIGGSCYLNICQCY